MSRIAHEYHVRREPSYALRWWLATGVLSTLREAAERIRTGPSVGPIRWFGL
jgi:hypothetical protein